MTGCEGPGTVPGTHGLLDYRWLQSCVSLVIWKLAQSHTCLHSNSAIKTTLHGLDFCPINSVALRSTIWFAWITEQQRSVWFPLAFNCWTFPPALRPWVAKSPRGCPVMHLGFPREQKPCLLVSFDPECLPKDTRACSSPHRQRTRWKGG